MPSNKTNLQLASATIEVELRRAILGGDFAPGQHIVQENIARQHGVSRLPVRQALQVLADEGLVTITPHSGARVATVTLEDCIDLYEFREAVEPLVVRRSVAAMTKTVELEIEEALLHTESLSHDANAWLQADQEFHRRVIQLCTIPQALKLSQQLFAQTQRYRRYYMQSLTASRIEFANLEHRTIFSAIRRGDAVEASKRAELHIRGTRLALQTELESQSNAQETGSPSTRSSRRQALQGP